MAALCVDSAGVGGCGGTMWIGSGSNALFVHGLLFWYTAPSHRCRISWEK